VCEIVFVADVAARFDGVSDSATQMRSSSLAAMQMAAAFVSSSPRHALLCAARSAVQGSRLESPELGVSRSAGPWRPGLVWAASKQKRKGKEKRKAGGGRGRGPDWNFDALMLVWDEVFNRSCEDAAKAAAIRALGHKGLER
jgi:hypothetical protein